MSSSSHQVFVLPVGTSPPRPSMVPSPTTPEFFGSVTLISALHDELPVLLPAHLPGDESKSRGSCDANSVVPGVQPEADARLQRQRARDEGGLVAVGREAHGLAGRARGDRRLDRRAVQRLVARAAVDQRLGGEHGRARRRDRRLGADGVAGGRRDRRQRPGRATAACRSGRCQPPHPCRAGPARPRGARHPWPNHRRLPAAAPCVPAVPAVVYQPPIPDGCGP